MPTTIEVPDETVLIAGDALAVLMQKAWVEEHRAEAGHDSYVPLTTETDHEGRRERIVCREHTDCRGPWVHI